MSALHDEKQVQNLLDLEEKKRAVDERMTTIEKMREDKIAMAKAPTKLTQQHVKSCFKKGDIKTQIKALAEVRRRGS